MQTFFKILPVLPTVSEVTVRYLMATAGLSAAIQKSFSMFSIAPYRNNFILKRVEVRKAIKVYYTKTLAPSFLGVINKNTIV